MLFRKDGIGEETYEILQKIVEIRKTESSDMKENRQKKELFAVCSWGISFGQAEK